MVLLEDEQNVLRWLSQYGPLHKIQIRKLLHYKSDVAAKKIVQSLRRNRYITVLEDGDYFGVDKYCHPDPRMVTAVWVLLKFGSQVLPSAHRQADIPSQIFFLKDGTPYEIVVLYEEEDHLLRLLTPHGGVKYIIVLPSMDMADLLTLPDAPYLFATVQPSEGPEPVITFYSSQEE